MANSLPNQWQGTDIELFYWRSRNREVDFVMARGEIQIAIEVKSSRRKASLPGIDALSREFSPSKKLLIGAKGIPMKWFLQNAPTDWF